MRFEPHEIHWTSEKSKRLWDYYSTNPKYRSTFFGFQAGKKVARALMRRLRASDDARFLDFSCGHGDLLAALAPHLRGAQELYGTDFSDTFVAAVIERFKAEPRFKGATLITSLPSQLPAHHFHVVVATEVVEHLHDHELEAMLEECKRVLKPGGTVFLTTPNEEDYDASKLMCPDCGCIYHKWQHIRTWTAASLQARMEAAGLRTRAVVATSWRPWLGDLRSLVTQGRIERNSLIYIGETAG